MCRPIRWAGVLIILAFAVYAHVFYRLDAGRYMLPPFRPELPREPFVGNLGAENRLLGHHLAEGQGFVDPFGAGTGPTAWMSPVYPAIVAGLMRVFGTDIYDVGIVVAIGQAIGILIVWLAIVAMVQPKSPADGIALLAALILFLLTHFDYTFLFTQDTFLGALGLAAIMRYAPSLCPPQSWRGWTRWGLIGGLSTSAFPALVVPWLLISLPVLRRNWRRMAIAAFAFFLVMTPWTIRNAVVCGRFIPVKSNAVYELYQTLKYSEDGVVTEEALKHHPGRPGIEQEEYRQLGESAYLSKKFEQAKELLADHPGRYLRHCVNRLWTMFVWGDSYFDNSVLPLPHWFCRVVYPLPLLGLLAILIRRQWRREPAAGIAVLATIGLTIPYVLVSYYERYEYAFAPAKIVLVYYGLKMLWDLRVMRTPA
jgi:hypothetical protein